MNEIGFNSYAIAQKQFDSIANQLSLDTGIRDLLRDSIRECHVSIPIRLEDGRIKVFRGFRVLHNDARGPGKGGVRFHPQETIDICRALAMWTTWKCAVVDIPLGGSSGGVICDPHDYTPMEMEQICRGWVRQLIRNLGPYRDVPAPDMMASPQYMLWMLDEYETLCGEHNPGFISGKPARMFGSKGRLESTGYGVVYTIRELLRDMNIPISDTRASIQGFGNVGRHAFKLYQKMGGSVISVSCWDQNENKAVTYRMDNGIDYELISGITDRFGGIDQNRAVELGFEVLPGDAWLKQDVDILIPAAMENQITKENVDKINSRVKIIAEGANGPTLPDADNVLKNSDIVVIPDLLANSGGAICSYLEQVQSNQNYFWELDEVLAKLDVKITAAFIAIRDLASKRKLYMRDAAQLIAVERVAQACRDRGWV